MRQTQLPKGQEDGGERIQTLWYFLIEMQTIIISLNLNMSWATKMTKVVKTAFWLSPIFLLCISLNSSICENSVHNIWHTENILSEHYNDHNYSL